MIRLFALAAIVVALPFAAACGSDDGGGGGGQVIEVTASDFAFDPKDLSADPGEVTFKLTNAGENPHALEIEGEGVEEESDTINAGDSTELTVDLEEGTYEIYCPVGDHKDRGMVGTLTVGSGAASGGATDETETSDTETGETETEDTTSSDGY